MVHQFFDKGKPAVALVLLAFSSLCFATPHHHRVRHATAKVEKPAAAPAQSQTASKSADDAVVEVKASGSALVAPIQSYQALAADKSYHNAVARWARESGWNLSWELDNDYAFNFPADFGKDFFKALDGVCANLNGSGVHARAIVYEGNHVVRIVKEGAKR